MVSLAEGDLNSSPRNFDPDLPGEGNTESIVSLITVITNICETLNLPHHLIFVFFIFYFDSQQIQNQSREQVPDGPSRSGKDN